MKVEWRVEWQISNDKDTTTVAIFPTQSKALDWAEGIRKNTSYPVHIFGFQQISKQTLQVLKKPEDVDSKNGK